MKKNIKKFLPILLSLVIICSIIWYLFVYDRGFLQDVLLTGARYFESQESHNVATWLYNQAYLHSGNDNSVIIELAERFKKIGNYTQAEIVLTNAIAKGASADLYIALSKTYVEQNKLLDAATMLNNITDQEIKEQLNTLRPSTPVADPAPGFYNQYINVSITSENASNLYIATDGDFPSVENRYTDSITLSGGENKIYAVAVDVNGLVSFPAYFGYTVGGVVEEVVINDSVLDALYREILNIPASQQLLTSDLWKITSVTVPEGVTDLAEIGHLVYLDTLVINGINVDDLQFISPLTQLKTLIITDCPLSANDLQVLGTLPNLENLTLKNCSLSNISGLAGATRLLTLDLSNNAIKDLTSISSMENLTSLNLSSNALTNLSAISALTKLTALDISYNSVKSLTPLATCKALSVLVANNNQIAEIPMFNDPTVLITLDLTSNHITIVEDLAAYTSLANLYLSYNQITDVSILSVLSKLTVVNISNNKVTKLPVWSTDCALVEINASNNKITSVSPLKGLAKLNNVYLDYNKITNINPLADCRMLVRVSVYGNKISDVSKLTSMSVIVNYNPT